MAVKRNFYLNDVLVEPPKNSEEMSIKFSFDKDSAISTRQISITDFNWVRDNADTVMKWFNDGRAFEGLPLRYELDRAGVVEKAFNGYHDMTDGAILSTNSYTRLTAKERQKIDWLNDTADSVSFPRLFDIGEITTSDFLYMPYVISTIPNYVEALMMTVSMTVIAFQIGEQITALQELAAHAVNFFAWSFILAAIFRILYIVGLMIVLLSLLKSIKDALIQDVKYHACMRVKDLLRIGAAHFGYTVKAEIFDTAPFNDLVILPEKYALPLAGSFLGFIAPSVNQVGFPNESFGEFLRKIKAMFKQKIVINSNKELILIREDKQVGVPQYQLPDVYQPQFRINADELKSNYEISFATDINDKNTLQEYKGTRFQVITTNSGVTDIAMNLVKGLEQVNIPYALAKRKTELTAIEEIFDVLFDIFKLPLAGLLLIYNSIAFVVRNIESAITTLFKALHRVPFVGKYVKVPHFDPIPPLSIDQFDPRVGDRIGMMKLENDFVNVPKMFIIKQGSEPKFNKIADNNATVLSARYLWDNFHRFAVSFVPSADRPTANQYKILELEKFTMTFSDYEKIKDNNAIFTADNKPAQIVEGEWFDFEEKAKIKVRIPFLYTNKLIEKYLEPDGQ